tara:strand:+ start:269 stop:580 length:312 start_codon:yes stop_codon:yes gene_type:complete
MKDVGIIVLAAIAFFLAVFFLAMALQKLGWIKSSYLKDEDGDWIPDALETEVSELRKELAETSERLSSELADVGAAIKEVGNQLGDVPKAFSGKKRPGRKPKK